MNTGDFLYQASRFDWMTPAWHLLTRAGGVTLEFEPPTGRSANDVVAHLRRYGIRTRGLWSVARGRYLVNVARHDADRAQLILEAMT